MIMRVISKKKERRITLHSRIGLAPSVADVGSEKWKLRQPPTEVRERHV